MSLWDDLYKNWQNKNEEEDDKNSQKTGSNLWDSVKSNWDAKQGNNPSSGAGAPPSPEGKAEPETDSLGSEQQNGKRIKAPRERALNANSVE